MTLGCALLRISSAMHPEVLNVRCTEHLETRMIANLLAPRIRVLRFFTKGRIFVGKDNLKCTVRKTELGCTAWILQLQGSELIGTRVLRQSQIPVWPQ